MQSDANAWSYTFTSWSHQNMVFRYLSKLETIRQQSMRCLRRTRVWLCLVAALLWTVIFQVKGRWRVIGITMEPSCSKLCLDAVLLVPDSSFSCRLWRKITFPWAGATGSCTKRRCNFWISWTSTCLKMPRISTRISKSLGDYCTLYCILSVINWWLMSVHDWCCFSNRPNSRELRLQGSTYCSNLHGLWPTFFLWFHWFHAWPVED